jgi:hypothetical protein
MMEELGLVLIAIPCWWKNEARFKIFHCRSLLTAVLAV